MDVQTKVLSYKYGGHNFLISKPFLTMFSASDAPRRGVQLLFEQKKQWSPYPGSGMP
jgi:hypothetical protein